MHPAIAHGMIIGGGALRINTSPLLPAQSAAGPFFILVFRCRAVEFLCGARGFGQFDRNKVGAKHLPTRSTQPAPRSCVRTIRPRGVLREDSIAASLRLGRFLSPKKALSH